MTSENLIEKHDKILRNVNRIKLLKKYLLMNLQKKLGQVYYLPHQPVLREDKETTTILTVLDAPHASNGHI